MLMVFHALISSSKLVFLPEFGISPLGCNTRTVTFPNLNSFSPQPIWPSSHAPYRREWLSFHQCGSHTWLLPLIFLTFRVQSPACIDSTSLIDFTSAYRSFSTAEMFSQNLILSCLDDRTTFCPPASHCWGDFSKYTYQLCYCLVSNPSQHLATFRIKPKVLSMTYEALLLLSLAYLFGKIKLHQSSEKSVLSLFSGILVPCPSSLEDLAPF